MGPPCHDSSGDLRDMSHAVTAIDPLARRLLELKNLCDLVLLRGMYVEIVLCKGFGACHLLTLSSNCLGTPMHEFVFFFVLAFFLE